MGKKLKLQFLWGFQNIKNHLSNLFNQRMMRYIIQKEMVETRLVQHHRNSGSTLKDFCKVIKTHRTINVLWVLIYF